MTYLYPFMRGTRISQNFGANPNQGANGPGGHTGTDYAVDVGTAVRAAADGVIELSSWVTTNYQENPWWLTQMGGDSLVLNCGSTKPTFIYAHLSDSLIDAGQRVYKGQIIGYSGNTGTATTGPHCHVEALPPGYVLNSPTYGRVDPDVFFDEYYSAIQYDSAPTTGNDEDMAQIDNISDAAAAKIGKAMVDAFMQYDYTTDEGKPAKPLWLLRSMHARAVEQAKWTGEAVATAVQK